MKAAIERLREPSTHAGIAGVAQALKAVMPHYAAALDAASLVFGTLAAVMAERAKQS